MQVKNSAAVRSSAVILVLALSLQGCASLSNTERGAVGGAAAGAVIGGIIGNAAGSTAKGSILGAVLGGAAGAAIGNRMDDQAEDLQDKLPNAKVERVGEGIQVTFDSGILFDVNSNTLRGAAQENLASLATRLEEYEGTVVLVVGHTDSSGDPDYNQGLSERRADAARSFLRTEGLADDRLAAQGRGEAEPIAEEDTQAGMQANRRVEIAIYAGEDLRAEMLRRHGG